MTPAVRSEVLAVYAAVDAAVAAAGPRCDASGRCCRFTEYGHTLFLSHFEAELLLEGMTTSSPLNAGSPPHPNPPPPGGRGPDSNASRLLTSPPVGEVAAQPRVGGPGLPSPPEGEGGGASPPGEGNSSNPPLTRASPGDACPLPQGERGENTPSPVGGRLRDVLSTLARPISRDTCPFQVNNLCTARDARPLGCRIYFCDPAYQDTGTAITEDAVARLKHIADAHGTGWHYAPLHVHLNESAPRPVSERDAARPVSSPADTMTPAAGRVSLPVI